MNNSINNISFGANIVTKIRGRNNIMQEVAQKFAERTQGIEGTMRIERGDKIGLDNSIVFNLNRKQASYLEMEDEFDKFMGQGSQNIPADKITDHFVKIFKSIQLQDKYDKSTAKLKKEIENVKQKLYGFKNLLKGIDEDNAFFKPYSFIISNLEKRLVKLHEEKRVFDDSFRAEIKEIAENDSLIKGYYLD